MTMPAPVPRPPSAGWYADPWQQRRLRFFDGIEWTERSREHSALVVGLLVTGAGVVAIATATLLVLVGGLALFAIPIGCAGVVALIGGVVTMLVAFVYRLVDRRRAHRARAVTPTAGAARSGAWLTDPAHRYAFRYWDGTRWTADVSTAGNRATDPVTESYLPPPPVFVASPALTLAGCAVCTLGVVIGALGLWGWTAEWHRVGGESWEGLGSLAAVLIAVFVIVAGAIGAVIGAVRRHRSPSAVSGGSR